MTSRETRICISGQPYWLELIYCFVLCPVWILVVRLDCSVVLGTMDIVLGLSYVPSSAGHDFIVACSHKFTYLPRVNRFICKGH